MLLKSILIALTFVAPSYAMTVKDFEAKTTPQQSTIVADFVVKMTTTLQDDNPALSQAIRTWFTVTPAGKLLPGGIESLLVELMALDQAGREGKADLSKIQVESVMVWLVKQHFSGK